MDLKQALVKTFCRTSIGKSLHEEVSSTLILQFCKERSISIEMAVAAICYLGSNFCWIGFDTLPRSHPSRCPQNNRYVCLIVLCKQHADVAASWLQVPEVHMCRVSCFFKIMQTLYMQTQNSAFRLTAGETPCTSLSTSCIAHLFCHLCTRALSARLGVCWCQQQLCRYNTHLLWQCQRGLRHCSPLEKQICNLLFALNQCLKSTLSGERIYHISIIDAR